jgi:hypothetical protein
VTDYRFPEATRKNNPPAKIAAEGHVPLIPKAEYTYSPRRPPELRFDPTGRTDELPKLLAIATQRKLTEAEAWALAEALRVHEPWLEWAGKREARSFAVDPVALHIHERVSALLTARRVWNCANRCASPNSTHEPARLPTPVGALVSAFRGTKALTWRQTRRGKEDQAHQGISDQPCANIRFEFHVVSESILN